MGLRKSLYFAHARAEKRLELGETTPDPSAQIPVSNTKYT